MVSVTTPGRSGSARPTRHGVPSGLAPIARISPILTRVVDRPALRSRLDDAVGSVALRDPVQRDGGATSSKCDAVFAHAQAGIANLRQRFGQLLRRRPVAVRPLGREMIRIKLPQRLHRRIKCAAGDPGKQQRGLQQRHHVGVGSNKNAGAVEGRDRRVGAVQTELLLQPPHVQDTALDQPFGLGPVRMIDLDRHLRAERRSVPAHGIAGRGGSATGQKRRSGCASRQ